MWNNVCNFLLVKSGLQGADCLPWFTIQDRIISYLRRNLNINDYNPKSYFFTKSKDKKGLEDLLNWILMFAGELNLQRMVMTCVCKILKDHHFSFYKFILNEIGKTNFFHVKKLFDKRVCQHVSHYLESDSRVTGSNNHKHPDTNFLDSWL